MTDFMFEWIGGVGMLDFSGDLTMERVEKLRHGLLVSLENADWVVVNLRKVTSLDAGCFPLFCSAHRVFTRLNKGLFLVGLRPQLFDGEEEGSLPRRGADCKEFKSCLWDNFKHSCHAANCTYREAE